MPLHIRLVRSAVSSSHHSCLFEAVEITVIAAVVNISFLFRSKPPRLKWKNNYTFYLTYVDECLASYQSEDRNSDLVTLQNLKCVFKSVVLNITNVPHPTEYLLCGSLTFFTMRQYQSLQDLTHWGSSERNTAMIKLAKMFLYHGIIQTYILKGALCEI